MLHMDVDILYGCRLFFIKEQHRAEVTRPQVGIYYVDNSYTYCQ